MQKTMTLYDYVKRESQIEDNTKLNKLCANVKIHMQRNNITVMSKGLIEEVMDRMKKRPNRPY